MLKKIVDKKKPGTMKEWVTSIPWMVCAGDIEEGEGKMSDAHVAMAPINEALLRGSHQVLMIRICDLVEGATDLKKVMVSVDMESDIEGSRYPTMRVRCTYAQGADSNEDGNSIENELQDWLGDVDVSRDIYVEPITDKNMLPQIFIKHLAQVLMGKSAGPEWLAARERDALAKVTPTVTKTKKRSMSL